MELKIADDSVQFGYLEV